MEQWLPQRPLILTPLIPLIWTVSWLGTVTIRHAFGFDYPDPGQLQDSVLIISAVVLVANIYNLVLIYCQAEAYHSRREYMQRALLLAIILIISIVLAWGQPKKILIPNQLTGGVIAYIILSCGQALLANYFVKVARPLTRKKAASLLLPIIELAVIGMIAPLTFVINNGWSGITVGGVLLVFFAFAQWNNVPRLFIAVPATKSGFYQLLIGINLATIITTIFFGLDTLVMLVIAGNANLLAACTIQSVIFAGISGTLIAAMQRYDNDYRYGHAVGREIKYIIGGILLAASTLLLACGTLVMK